MMSSRLQSVLDSFVNSSGRSKEAVKGVALSVLAKMVYVVSSFLIVPLTIDYVNPTQYGIWLTLSSIVGWVVLFDLGLGNGFRNRFAEAKADGNMELARCYLSTTYFAVTVLILVVFLIIVVGNSFIDWSSVLNIEPSYSEELGRIFVILSAFFCLSMVANLVSSLLMADQKAGHAAMIQGGGQLLSLIAVWVLTLVSKGSLTNLALYFAGMPCLLTMVVTIFVFTTGRYKEFAPKVRYVRLSLIRDILGIGVQFFIIYLCMIFLFQIVNIVISREIGPDAVTEYNIAYKYFALLNTINVIILTPFWSAFTDAYKRSDYPWMRTTLKSLELVWMGITVVGVLMYLAAPYVYMLWIGGDVEVSRSLSFCVLIYVVILNLGNLYMYLINGIGTVRIQLVIYLSFAIVSWPLMTLACRLWGVEGVVFVPTLVLLSQAVFGNIQIHKLLNRSARGIWRR